jgi:hypothetical protein
MKLKQICEDVGGVAIPVFRGLPRPLAPGQTTVTLPVRKDRRPLEMSLPFSALFNYAFEVKFGIPNIRKTCVFSSTNKEQAGTYASDGNGGTGNVVQLVVPQQAVIVFNPQVNDSLYMEEDDPGYMLQDFMGELAEEWSEKNGGEDPSQLFDQTIEDLGVYMSSTGTQLFTNLIQAGTGGDPKRTAYYTKLLNRIARSVTSGYKQATPQQFAKSYGKRESDIEIIIAGIDSYQGTVVDFEHP